MSDQVPTTFVTEFQNNMKLSLQQTKPLLWGLGINRPCSGKLAELDDLIGHVRAKKLDTRHGDISIGNTPHSRVWCAKPLPDYYSEMVDRDDSIQAKIALESGYMMTGTATIVRAKDDAFIAGLFGTMLTGSDEGALVTNVFPAANIVGVDVGAPVGTPTRMNVAKLRAARKKLAQNFVDMSEKRFIVVTAEQVDDLMNETPIASKEFNDEGGKVNSTGRMAGFMGFDFIEMELGNPLLANSGLSLDANGYRKNPFWVQSGMASCPWNDLYTSIDPIPMKAGAKLIYVETTVAATRTENGKVGYILNTEAA